MKIKRGVVCRGFCFLSGDTRVGLEFGTEGLTVLGRRPRTIPFVAIAGRSSVRTRFLRRGVIEIPLMDRGQVVFSCLAPNRAETFTHALNEAWQEAWRREIEPCRGAMQSLAGVVDRLEAPRNFPAACLVEPFRQQAEALFRFLPTDLPDAMLTAELQECIGKIRKFHEAPDDFRDRAVDDYMTREVTEMVGFFETMETVPLTEDQRRVIVCDEDATLVLAGAGSGKTSVITAKAAYLIRRGIRRPEEILLMAFGKDAAEEMAARIRQRCDAEVPAMTFHKLAYDIIAEVEGRKPPLAPQATDDKALQILLKEMLLQWVENDRKTGLLLLRWFSEFLVPARSEWDFGSQHEYFSYIESHELRTLQGELVRSFEELEIANWLCINGIAYEYEPVYEHALPAIGRKDYTPDFRLTTSGVYLEHFGVRREKDRNGNEYLTTAPCVDRAEYLAGMEWKRTVHAEYGTTLVETYSYEKSEGILLSALEEKLTPYVVLNPISTQEILSRLKNMGQFDDFTGTLGTFLRHFKGSGTTMEECRDKAKGLSHQRDRRRGRAFLKIFEPIYREYQKRLGGYIDFDDMISRATDHVRESRYQSPYRHLLVDEFQDLSRGRADLLLALKEQHPDCRLFAVGDDWQSIYRFSGSDIHLMCNFGRIFGGTFGSRKDIHQIMDLGRTFRNVDRIAHPARRFILRNPSQIAKEVVPAGTTPEPAIYVLWNQENGRNRSDEALERALARLQEQAGKEPESVLLVGRYHRQRPKNLSRLGQRHPGLSLSFQSIHASKGLEADHVVILGADSGRLGLPSEIVDDPLLDLVLPEPEPYEHAEERRVFYVALTRARRSVTIIARPDQPSDFVNELLEDGEYEVAEMTDMMKTGQNRRRRYRCPRCEGHLVPDGRFRYACEHRHHCGASLPVCAACGAGLPLRNEAVSDTSKCACGATFRSCPACPDGWLVERTGKYGPFLGCVNYPRCRGRRTGHRKMAG